MRTIAARAVLAALTTFVGPSCSGSGGASGGDDDPTSTSTATWGTDDGSGSTSSSDDGADPVCGNAIVEDGEECEPPELECEPDCRYVRRVDAVTGAFANSCALIAGSRVRCWGAVDGGLVAEPSHASEYVGDDEPASEAGLLDFGAPIVGIDGGGNHACALTEQGAVYCWGRGTSGQLGLPGVDTVGLETTPAQVGPVEIDDTVTDLSVGLDHACAITNAGELFCWGWASFGELGYGSEEDVGDDETPADAGPVPTGGNVVFVAAGSSHTCVILEDETVRCWGFEPGAGYPAERIGDDEPASAAPLIPVGAPAIALAAGGQWTCVLLEGGGVRCWGSGIDGELGYPGVWQVGYDETPADMPLVDLGGPAIAVSANSVANCALLESGSVVCWGSNDHSQLGQVHQDAVGFEITPAQAGPVPVGRPVTQLDVGVYHVCVRTVDGAARCWGRGLAGQLGYGDGETTIGNDETPAQAGDVPVFP